MEHEIALLVNELMHFSPVQTMQGIKVIMQLGLDRASVIEKACHIRNLLRR
jgi:hypothetical protein